MTGVDNLSSNNEDIIVESPTHDLEDEPINMGNDLGTLFEEMGISIDNFSLDDNYVADAISDGASR